MHSPRTIRIAGVAALLVCLLASAESQACLFRGHRQRNAIPSWARYIDFGNLFSTEMTCPPGYEHLCCTGGNWVPYSNACEPGHECCHLIGAPLPICMGGEYTYRGSPSGCEGSSRRLYAMVCGSNGHMRFALPCETPHGYYSLRYLGRSCGPCR
jgi:hypothetical protein